MASDGKLVFDTKIDDSGFNSGLKKINNTAKSTSNGISSLNNKTKSLTTSFAKLGLAIYALKKAMDLGKEAVNLASDLTEVQNVVDVVFGESKEEINSFSKALIDIAGIGELSAKRYISAFGAMGASMGIMDKDNISLAKTMTRLTGDFASFYNVSLDRAKIALDAVYSGETETLKRYGIMITQVNLKEYARQQGITKSLDKMTQQEKLMLRLNYVLNATRNAQGDFIRTQGSWANQTRILNEKWKQLLATMGTLIIKVLTPIVILLNKILSLILGIVSIFSKVEKQQNKITSSSGNSVKNQKALTSAVKKTNKELKGTVAGFDEVNVLQKKTSDISDTSDINGGIGLGLPDLSEYVKIDVDTSGIDKITKKITDAFEKIQPKFEEFKTTMEKTLKPVKKLFKDVFEDGITPMLNELKTIWEDLVDSFSKFWEKWGEPTLKKIKLAFKNNIATIQRLWDNILEPIWNNFIKIIDKVWKEHLKPFVDELLDFVGTLVDASLDVYNGFISPIVNWIIDIFGPAFVTVFNLIVEVLGDFTGVLIDVGKATLKFLKGTILFLTGIFTNDWEKAWEGISLQFEAIWDGMKAIVVGVVNIIIALTNTMVKNVIDSMNWVIRALNNFKWSPPKWMKEKFKIGDIGIDMEEIDVKDFKIPKLATGTDTPARNKISTDKVSSQQYMTVDAFQKMIDSLSKTQESLTIEADADMTAIIKMLRLKIKKEDARVGTSLRTVG